MTDTMLTPEKHKGYKVWDCENSCWIERVRWVNLTGLEYAIVDVPVRIVDGQVVETVHKVRRFELIAPRHLVLVNPTNRQHAAWMRDA